MPRKNAPTTALDPYLARLGAELVGRNRTVLAGDAAEVRDLALCGLLFLHYKNPKSALDGWDAMILAGRHGIPAPLWAIDLLEEAALKSKTERIDLGVALGFKGIGKGQTKKSEVQRRLQADLSTNLCMRVRKLIGQGTRPMAACRIVATQLNQSPIDSWNTTGYILRRPNAETLQRTYRRWEKTLGQHMAMIDSYIDTQPLNLNDTYLAILS